jgi:hypothetical protein
MKDRMKQIKAKLRFGLKLTKKDLGETVASAEKAKPKTTPKKKTTKTKK